MEFGILVFRGSYKKYLILNKLGVFLYYDSQLQIKMLMSDGLLYKYKTFIRIFTIEKINEFAYNKNRKWETIAIRLPLYSNNNTFPSVKK